MELARIGATPKGGVKRLTLTDEDRGARDLFVPLGTRGRAGGRGRRHRQHLRAPRRAPTPSLRADRHGQPSRFAALRRQVRRRLRRDGGAGGAAHAERRGRAHARAAGSRVLDQRGGLALQAGDDGLGRVRRRLRPGRGARAGGPGRQDSGRGAGAHRLRGRRAAAQARRATSKRTSSRGRCWRTRARRSAWCRARSASAGTTSRSGARTRTRARRRWSGARTR